MSNDTQYHAAEMAALARQLLAVEGAPLADRKAARADMADYLTTPELVAERIGWALDGNYGYGAQVRMQEIAGNKRINRPAAAVQLIGALDCQCPADFVRQAWHTLTPEQKIALDVAVMGALESTDQEL